MKRTVTCMINTARLESGHLQPDKSSMRVELTRLSMGGAVRVILPDPCQLATSRPLNYTTTLATIPHPVPAGMFPNKPAHSSLGQYAWWADQIFFFFCVPGHARFSVRWVRRSPQSAAVSQPVPKASCGPPHSKSVGLHRTGPCLASQVIEGGAGLQNAVAGLRTRAAWTFVWVGNVQSVEVGEELTVSSSQSKDCDLSRPNKQVRRKCALFWLILPETVEQRQRPYHSVSVCRHSLTVEHVSSVFLRFVYSSGILQPDRDKRRTPRTVARRFSSENWTRRRQPMKENDSHEVWTKKV